MKIKLQHTDGPWNEDGIYVILRYADKHDMDIDESDKVMPFSTSDARLIAAAPEMLEVLIEFNKLAHCSNDRFAGYSDIIYHDSKNIIEKATGMSIEEVLSE